jgi:hypothetical protein
MIIRAITGTLGMTPTLEELDLWEEHKRFGLTIPDTGNDTTGLDDDDVVEEDLEVIESDEATDSDLEDKDSDEDDREDLWVDESNGDGAGDENDELKKKRTKQTKRAKQTKGKTPIDKVSSSPYMVLARLQFLIMIIL